MEKPFLLFSDVHFHSWSAFSEPTPAGVNSRLQQIVDAIGFAAADLMAKGGDTIIIAGDVFHKRGSIEPSVLNPVMDLFKNLSGEHGLKIYAIPGNHDLEKNDSERLSNAITALESVGVDVAHQCDFVQVGPSHVVCLFPWFSTVKDLLHTMEMYRSRILTSFDGEIDQFDAVIHAPVDGVLPHLPSHGLDASGLSRIGFDRVFSGHYHNHVDLGDGVFSVGALTHQTWGDIDSLAGYMLVTESDQYHVETSHPKFVELTGEESEEDAAKKVAGNYVRVRGEIDSDEELKEIREGVLALGAKGVTVIPIRKTTVTREGAVPTTSGSVTIEASIKTFLEKREATPRAHTLALEVLSEARAS